MLLGLVLLLPLLFSLLLFLGPKSMNAKYIALGGSLVVLAFSLPLLYFFSADMAHSVSFHPALLKWLDIDFVLTLDGFGLMLVLLTTVLTPIIILSSFNSNRDTAFYALILLMQMALIGVFSANDVLLFYIFWELALIPIYFITGLYGSVNSRGITIKFFLYTMIGSLFMLMAILFLHSQTPGAHSFAFADFYKITLSPTAQLLVFLAFFLAFAIKIPIFPFHTWQPDTYTVSPTQGSMLLAAVMGKMGLFGLVRFILPICPDVLANYGVYFIALATFGLIYASIISITQKDFKRLIAYSSMAHVGLMAVAILVVNKFALEGAIIQMVAHGVNVVALFYCYHIIQSRTGTSTIANLGGIATKAPRFAVFFMITILGSVALPLTSSFIGEFLMLLGIYHYSALLAFVAGTSIIFGAVYMLWATQRIMFGKTNSATEDFSDLTKSETAVFVPLVILILGFGIYPNYLLDIIGVFVKTAL